MNYLYLFLTISTNIISQLLIKWRIMLLLPQLPSFSLGLLGKINLFFHVLLDPFIFLAIILNFISGLFWMITMSKFEISYVYPFTTIGFIAIMLLSILFFGESYNLYKIFGSILIIIGIIVTSRGI